MGGGTRATVLNDTSFLGLFFYKGFIKGTEGDGERGLRDRKVTGKGK